MTWSTAASPLRTASRVACVTLILVQAWRVLEIAPRWIEGLPPAYAGQYETRLLGAVVGISILAAVLMNQTSVGHTRSGRIACWGLLVTAAAVFAVQVSTGR